MSSKKKGGFFKIFLTTFIIISIVGVSTYFLLPKIIIRTMMSENIQKNLPPEINKALTLSKRGVSKALKQMDIQPQQAIEEIDKIDHESVERIVGRLSQNDIKNPGIAADIIFEEIRFSHIDKNKVKTFFRRNVTKKDIKLALKAFEDNKMKTRFLLPVVKNSLKEMIQTSSSN